MVAASGREAVDNAREYGSCSPGMCLKYVRTWWEVPSLYPDAITAWREAEHKHGGDRALDPPLGAPVFWAGGSEGHGHIAIYTGGEDMRSTDCTVIGDVSDEHGSWVRKTWGLEYLGWTGDLNGVRLPLDEDEGQGEDMPSDEHLIDLVRRGVQAELGDENAGALSDRVAEKVWAEVLAYHGGQPDEVRQKAGPGWLVYTERRVEALQADVAAIMSALGISREGAAAGQD